MARKLTPERQKLKQEALSLRYDYGLSVPKIMRQLNLKRPTLYRYLSHNSHSGLSHNIQHLEGDCLEILPTLPDNSIDVLLTDPPYSVMEDYEWDKKDSEFYHQWLSLVKRKLKDKHAGFIFFDARRLYEFEHILRNYFPITNRIIWIRKNKAKRALTEHSLSAMLSNR